MKKLLLLLIIVLGLVSCDSSLIVTDGHPVPTYMLDYYPRYMHYDSYRYYKPLPPRGPAPHAVPPRPARRFPSSPHPQFNRK